MLLIQNLKVKISRKLSKKNSLECQLIQEGKTRWLDVGSSRPSKGFKFMNIKDVKQINPQYAEDYYKADILHLQSSDYNNLGKFDLVRMQHVFEHFSPEEGIIVLSNVAQLLKQGSYLLITVPDLRIHARAYLERYCRDNGYFVRYAQHRVPQDAPPSFIFSVHAHQFGYSPNLVEGNAHKWCYDYEGLEYQVRKSNQFEKIRRLDILNPLASIPFTHNRPVEDVCLLAQKS